MIFFEKCDVLINGTGILAESASLSVDTPFASVDVLGTHFSQGYVNLGNLQNSVELSYFLETTKEPNRLILNQIKENRLVVPTTTLTIGGLSGSFYLDTYRVQVVEHQPVMVTVSYVGFVPISGSLTNSTNQTLYTTGFHTGIANYYSTTATLKYINPTDPSNIYSVLLDSTNFESCSYNFKNNLQPIYAIGSLYPIDIKQMAAEETVEIIHDNWVHASALGTSPATALNISIPDVVVNGTKLPEIAIRFGVASTSHVFRFAGDDYLTSRFGDNLPNLIISSGVVRSNRLIAIVNDSIKVNTTIVRYY